MIKIFVFDTNALISAHFLPTSVSRRAYDHALNKGIIVYSRETLNEFRRTFEKSKFDKYVDLHIRKEAINAFEKIGLSIDVSVVISECRDEKDNMFLELAVEAAADCIVSGDNDLLVLHPFRNIPILNARDFLSSF